MCAQCLLFAKLDPQSSQQTNKSHVQLKVHQQLRLLHMYSKHIPLGKLRAASPKFTKC